jgi:hypothetical protein
MTSSANIAGCPVAPSIACVAPSWRMTLDGAALNSILE